MFKKLDLQFTNEFVEYCFEKNNSISKENYLDYIKFYNIFYDKINKEYISEELLKQNNFTNLDLLYLNYADIDLVEYDCKFIKTIIFNKNFNDILLKIENINYEYNIMTDFLSDFVEIKEKENEKLNKKLKKDEVVELRRRIVVLEKLVKNLNKK